MARIIDGKAIAALERAKIAEKTEELKKKGVTPGLAVIIIGEDPASQVYVRNKHKACLEVGFRSDVYTLPENTTEEELLSLVDRLNADEGIDGILCQLPLPKHLDPETVVKHINPKKDVDAFGEANVGKIVLGKYGFLPCTPAGVMVLLEHAGVDVSGKNAVVIGRSNIVGKPMAMLLLNKSATVTVCHSKTKDLGFFTKNADILVSAVGKVKFVTADMVKEGAVVIDVGMNRDENGRLCGDVDYENVEKIASAITPVPGGVGPMTITMLLKNTLVSAERRAENVK